MRKGLLLCALLSVLVGCENLGDTLTDDLTTTLTFYDEDEHELTACSYQIGTVLPADSLPTKSFKKGCLVGGWRFYRKETAPGMFSYELPPNVTVKTDDKSDYGVVTSVTVTSIPLGFQVAWWKPIEYTIVFDGNGGKTADDRVSYEQLFRYHEEEIGKPLLKNEFTREGYIFNGWNTAEHKDETEADYEDEYALQDHFADEDGAVVTLYACWLPSEITITFDPNGGTGTTEQQAVAFAALPPSLPKNTTRTGWNFGGWKTASGVTFADGQISSSDDWEALCKDGANGSVTLSAVWQPRCAVSSSQGFDNRMTPAADGFMFTAPEGAAYQWMLRSDDTAVLKSTESTYTISYSEYENDSTEYTLVVTVFDASGVPAQTCWAVFHVNPQMP